MNLKTFIIGAVFLACLLGAGYCLHLAASTTTPAPRETFLLSVVLFLLSSVSSIVIGYFFARFSTTEKVDTFAERSAEKMINLSNQLIRLGNYLEETEDIADAEYNHYAAQNAYRHRVEAAARMAQNIAITNVTLGNDWLAVASTDTATKIDERYAAFRNQIEDVQELERLRQRRVVSTADGSVDAASIENRIAEIEQRIVSREETIPSVPVRQVPKKAVVAKQQIQQADECKQTGHITLTILKDLYIATGSGSLEPRMNTVPGIKVRLISTPSNADKDNLIIRPGTGTNYDFNVTLKSTALNVLVPKGDYVFEYTAEVDSITDNEPPMTAVSVPLNGVSGQAVGQP